MRLAEKLDWKGLNHSKMHPQMATTIEEKCKSTQSINYGQRSNYQRCVKNFHILTVHLDINQSFIYSPTDAPVSCFKKKNNIKIHIKICTKTAPTCFGASVGEEIELCRELAVD